MPVSTLLTLVVLIVAVPVVAAGTVTVLPPPPAGAATAPSPGWTVVDTPSSGTGVNDVLLGTGCADAFECWSVGGTLTNSGPPTPLMEEWNGFHWSLVPTAVPAGAGGAAFFAVTCTGVSECWAVGGTTGAGGGSSTGVLVERWNGTSWAEVPSPDPAGAVGGFLEGVSCASASDCWAVGFSTDETGAAVSTLAEHWDGRAWSIAPGPATGQAYGQLDGVTCISASDCWAVGDTGPVQQNPNFLPIFPAAVADQGLIEHWDGSGWSIVPSTVEAAPEGSYLTGVACTGSADCWASGSTTGAAGTADGTLMQHWDGQAWSTVASADPTFGTGSILDAVSCVGAGQCWAVGTAGPYGGGGGSGFRPAPFVESLHSGSWSIDATPEVATPAFLAALSCLPGAGCWAAGSVASIVQDGLHSLIEQMPLPSSEQGLFLVAADGGVFALGDASFHGSMGGRRLNRPMVGLAATPDGGGYWEVAADGGVFAFGDARYLGSMGGRHLDQPMVGLAATPDGGGYWEVAADGGVFAFGDARYFGSMGGRHLDQPVVGLAATPDGGGYWEVAADGGVFAFGDARYVGSTGALRLRRPVTGIATTPDGRGYWLTAADGGVFAFGDAGYLGSTPGLGISPPAPVVSVGGTPDGHGYWLTTSDGTTSAFGDARPLPSIAGLRLAGPVVGAGPA